MECQNVLGSRPPEALLRFFEDEEHARGFVLGQLRVGLLDGYRAAEGSRRDEAEGNVRLKWALVNPVDCDRSSMNSYYILCTAHPNVDRSRLSKKFGSYIVRINDPMELLARIDAAWHKHPLAGGRSVIVRVVYDKGDLLQPTPGLLPPPEYSYCQKPRVPFEEDQEFRYVLTCTADDAKLKAFANGLQRHLTLQLPDCRDICSLV